jgi:hypothetical protein
LLSSTWPGILRVVEYGVGQQLLQLAALVVVLLQTLGFGYAHTAEFALPVVETCVADPVLATQDRPSSTDHATFKTPMICSSVKGFRFIAWSFL